MFYRAQVRFGIMFILHLFQYIFKFRLPQKILPFLCCARLLESDFFKWPLDHFPTIDQNIRQKNDSNEKVIKLKLKN